MAPVFAHSRLRLYLLRLLDESPRHGYEVIRLLEERFQGLYAPSAGTVYPRLAKLEREGLVTHTTEGGRKVYSLTDAGCAEVAARQDELEDLEQEIRDSVSELAAEIREDVRGTASDLRREIREAVQQARSEPGDFRRMKEEWKEQARRAKEESRRAREEARSARQQARAVQEREEQETSANPARDLERLLDGFRDDIRDAARDHGIDAGQLREARRHLSTAAVRIVAVLRDDDRPRG
ncbi:MAG: helix-turn-helix transcriptional regulator [Streptomycetaceae bacterium]|nr:helix-turn-helix transcriptional regulator [Streptomycetaceae bacterium]